MQPSSPTTAATARQSGRGTSTATTPSAIRTRAIGAHERHEAADQSGAAGLNRGSQCAQSPQHEAEPVVTSQDGIGSSVGGKTSRHRLWDRIVSFENCRAAVLEECRTKRFRRRGFSERVRVHTDEIARRVSARLEEGFVAERPTEFDIVECGKTRHITTPSRWDAVCIRAVVRVVEPIVYARMSSRSYCPVRGRGGLRLAYDIRRSLRAAYRSCARHNKAHPKSPWRIYALKADISRFFESLEFGVMIEAFARIIDDQRVLSTVSAFLRFRDGLPIGAGYSAMIANCVLIDTDYVMEHADGCLGYFRYMDDMIMLFRSKAKARAAKAQLTTRLSAIGLRLNRKCQIFRTDCSPICVGGYKIRKGGVHIGGRVSRHLIRLMRRSYRHLSSSAKKAADSLYGYIKRTDSYSFKVKWREFK